MKNKKIKFIIIFVISVAILTIVPYLVLHSKQTPEEQVGQKIVDKQALEIEQIIKDRQLQEIKIDENVDPFGEDGIVRVLILGLDSRAGQTAGHCDVIQMLEINKNNNTVSITAVPRGTYSPLPFGKANTSTDYYISNACGLAGLDYGIDKIEKILGKKADYLAMVGFSETLGILRNLKLPTTETLQWLRQRQGYTIGEPQRARNHSTFIKGLLTKFLPVKKSKLDIPFHYILYKIVKTDLTFDESEKIVDVLITMDLANHPERISLFMRPSYNVQDIPYDPNTAGEYVNKMIEPIKKYLSNKSYSGVTVEQIDQRILDTLAEKQNDPEFVKWAYDNQLWLQIEDDIIRMQQQYGIITKYLAGLDDEIKKQQIITDYILEMKYLGLDNWVSIGEELLKTEIIKK
ncbi:MAG: hypothetical protein COY69_00990 [Candidatus Magasanikbacteria bacterium CG_4_10_14_0_8_um_filter_32_14]|uniref:Cell envelope-related transcriptional attenuator domain-containing protein n=1 Tax=Candidatus Magasanikbacteria bacterium CG_4_10_14_0_8_um_filter_32_14 TaxID=1974640 RepID=A0A2M7RB36_9BACT|nr:MAG: hypothetical protein COY69_00990 [Candidatus Magasanikbacteria bacterium CG_4_10_14_0_8_um_filter_32_14]